MYTKTGIFKEMKMQLKNNEIKTLTFNLKSQKNAKNK